MSTFEQLKAQALKQGLTGIEISRYVVEQQVFEREERSLERAKRKMKEYQERERAERERGLEREEREQEHEEGERVRPFELAKLQAEHSTGSICSFM